MNKKKKVEDKRTEPERPVGYLQVDSKKWRKKKRHKQWLKFSEFDANINLHIQEAQQTPYRVNKRTSNLDKLLSNYQKQRTKR